LGNLHGEERVVLKPGLLHKDGTKSDFTHCIFDLDGTLFKSADFRAATRTQAVMCVSKVKSLSVNEASGMIQKRRHELSDSCGFEVALSTTLHALGIALDTWAEFQSHVDVRSLLTADLRLRHGMEAAAKHCVLIAYSNMCRPLAEDVLSTLQISDFFSLIVSPQQYGETKPSPRTLRELAKAGKLSLRSTLSVGDRYHIDIEPVERLGGKGFLVGSPADLSGVFNLLT
jgi:FMN phosphatase YigB (HAD superfamily)